MCNKGRSEAAPSSVADPQHFDTDPDPAFLFNAYADPTFTMMRIRILLFNLMRIWIQILTLTFFPIWTLQCIKMIL